MKHNKYLLIWGITFVTGNISEVLNRLVGLWSLGFIIVMYALSLFLFDKWFEER